MSRPSRSNIAVAALIAGALVFGALGFVGLGDKVSDSLLFVAWSLTLLTLFTLAIHAPLRGGGSRASAWVVNALIASAAIAVVIAANIALYRHDVHFDATRQGRNTPPQQLTGVIEHLHASLALTYFYNAADPNALAVRDLIEIAARNHPLLAFRAIDLDKEPGLARDVGVHAYNTAVLQAGERKVLVENITDATRLGYAALRALRERRETICFVTGHGEPFRPTPPHFHYSHVETLDEHDRPGAGDVLVVDPAQLDRLQLALSEIGFDMRGIVTAATTAIPSDCSVVAELGPRTEFAPGEASLLAEYLRGGGRLLLLIDPLFPVDADLASRVLGTVGLSTEPAIVIDPLNHFRTDPDKVAVPYYPPHPITGHLALTVFPQVRPIHVVQPPAGVNTSVLAASSENSYRKPPSAAGGLTVAANGQGASEIERGAQALAVALEGVWPGAAPDKRFRLVLAGTSKFTTNEYFPYVSNGELSVAMLRWLADDDAMGKVTPQTYDLPQIVLTSRQMRDIFIALEVLLPLSTACCGVLMWWRRR
jgi:gliding motility-associatede transport system auxiliary component